jgi:hypothetical protein
VLLPLAVSLGLPVAGALVVAKIAHLTMWRLRLELFDVVLWLGLAETPVDELTARRRVQPSFGISDDARLVESVDFVEPAQSSLLSPSWPRNTGSSS